jgi:PPP family 3-phenylpropionic acid transporter
LGAIKADTRLRHWSFCSFYFSYFAFVGGSTPYLKLYLESLRFNAFEIGELMCLVPMLGSLAPTV